MRSGFYGFIISLLIITSCRDASTVVIDSNVQIDSTTQEIKFRYGIPEDTFNITEGQIKPNQFLADILLKYHISYPEIDKLVKKAESVFDVRKLASGKPYTLFCSKNKNEKARFFVYRPNATEYVVFDLRDSLNVYMGKKEVEVRTKTTEGTINSSLYLTLQEANASPALAMELANIYAWSIDFYRIQKGDKFKVVYEEKFADDEFIGIGEIEMAVFYHWNEPYYAFQYTQNEITDYYDETGYSLRKAFLKSPLKFGRMSSSYNLRRFHPVQKRVKPHLGTDYAAPRGTPIMSTGDGVVIEARYSKFNGNYVKVRHNSTYTTQYLHMNGFAKGVKTGTRVKQGGIIGYVGSTGLATGPHVCYRFWKNGKQIDSRKEKIPAAEPIKPQFMEQFKQAIAPLKNQLDQAENIKIEA